MILNKPVPISHLTSYLFIFAGMCAVILSALAFEHLGGYVPCKLCLEQREPWYFGIPVAGLAVVSLAAGGPSFISRGLVLICGLILAYSMVLGVHHAGVEWDWWQGPSDCGAVEGGLATTTTDLLKQLEETVTPSCTDAALRVLGLSFAGWNAVCSFALAVFAFRTATR